MKSDWPKKPWVMTKLPVFGDSLAIGEEVIHGPSGAKKFEILYGARDAEGRPTGAVDRKVDGHGHFVALKVEEGYQIIYWRKPQHEGGQQVYGEGDSENALVDLELDIKAKEAICVRIERLADSNDWRKASAEMRQAFEEWKAIFYWHTPREKELWERVKTARKTFYERRDAARTANKATKQRLIAEANALLGSTNWKAASTKQNELFERWKRTGTAGKAEDDALWSEFNSARQAFFDKRKAHYRQLDEEREKNRSAMQEIISEARSVAQYSTDWKPTSEKLKVLMDRWREIGSAGREQDERLWKEFNGIRRDFYDRQRIHFEKLDSEYRNRAEAKSAIVSEASGIASSYDYSRRNTERMKELDHEWKSIGFSGKDSEDRLWSLFQEAKTTFWDAKRADGARRQQEWRDHMQAVLDSKRNQISDLEHQIDHLNSKLLGMTNQEYITNIYRWISEKEAVIRELENDISDIKSKLYS